MQIFEKKKKKSKMEESDYFYAKIVISKQTLLVLQRHSLLSMQRHSLLDLLTVTSQTNSTAGNAR
jgi:hypothetical protein